MKFDLFDAMRTMKQTFGNSGEIILMQDNYSIQIRLQIFLDDKLHNIQFAVSRLEMEDSKVLIMNEKFKFAIESLKRVKGRND